MAQQSDIPPLYWPFYYFFYKLFNRSFFLFEAICCSLAFFHELLLENMTLTDNQFYQSSYFKYRNFHGTNFLFRRNFLRPATLLKKRFRHWRFHVTSSYCFWKYTYKNTALSSYFLALKEEGCDENYDNKIEIIRNFELLIVADRALPI